MKVNYTQSIFFRVDNTCFVKFLCLVYSMHSDLLYMKVYCIRYVYLYVYGNTNKIRRKINNKLLVAQYFFEYNFSSAYHVLFLYYIYFDFELSTGVLICIGQ